MPTNRTRRPRAPEPAISENVHAGLLSGDWDQGDFVVFKLGGERNVRAVWDSIGEELLADWLRNHPCSRPWAWWEYAAPEPRRRLGGIGDTFTDRQMSECAFGIPMGGWVTAWDVEYYNGRAKDIYGQPLERGPWYNYQDGDFTRVAIDQADPPRYESEAVYLQRRLFLTAAEHKHLATHPELLEPEAVRLDEGEG